jgi:hypothetical protein
MIKSGRIRRVGHVTCIERRNTLVSLKGRDHSEDLGVDGRIILLWVLEKQVWGV